MTGSSFYGKGNQSKTSDPAPTKQLAEGYEAKDGQITRTSEADKADKADEQSNVATANIADVKNTPSTKSKSVNQVLYDKASQVGMGLRGAWAAMTDDKKSQLRLQGGHADLDIGKHFRKGFQEEKAKDNAND